MGHRGTSASPALLAAAARALARGQVVLYPTDTLLGLAVRADAPGALAELFTVKRRPEGMPVSVAFSSLEEVEGYAELSGEARRALRRLLPGPHTLLVTPSAAGRRRLASGVLGPRGLLGVRVPDHPVARELARLAGPITSTSANRHGRLPARSVPEARRAFGREVAVYLPAWPAPSGHPSELWDLSGKHPRPVPRR
jgi:L-threonylcarbamoyladenylate synthase